MTEKHFQAFAGKISEFENREDAMKMAELCCEIFAENSSKFDAICFFRECRLWANVQGWDDTVLRALEDGEAAAD